MSYVMNSDYIFKFDGKDLYNFKVNFIYKSSNKFNYLYCYTLNSSSSMFIKLIQIKNKSMIV